MHETWAKKTCQALLRRATRFLSTVWLETQVRQPRVMDNFCSQWNRHRVWREISTPPLWLATDWLPTASIQTSPWAKWANGVVLVWWTSTCMENTPYTRCSNEILLSLSRNSDACLMRQQQRQRLLSGPLNFSAGRFWLLTWQIYCLFDFLLACILY